MISIHDRHANRDKKCSNHEVVVESNIADAIETTVEPTWPSIKCTSTLRIYHRYLPESHHNSRKQDENSSGDQEHGLPRFMICTEIGPDHGHIEQEKAFELETGDIN
jgi:hypothetical protein